MDHLKQRIDELEKALNFERNAKLIVLKQRDEAYDLVIKLDARIRKLENKNSEKNT